MASCFVDSMSTLGINGEGIGLNYHCGLFKQVFKQNEQNAEPNYWIEDESWLRDTNIGYEVKFKNFTLNSKLKRIDILGYEKDTKNYLNLFDIESVDYNLIEEGITFDEEIIEKNLTLFLYPDDSTKKGELLRIYQQYFMVSNAARLIIAEALEKGSNIHDLADYAFVQINDTHPSMVIPELIRIMTEEYKISFEESVKIVTAMTGYTNHTILAEALEKWPLEYLEEVVPDIVEIIKKLDKIVKIKYNKVFGYYIEVTNSYKNLVPEHYIRKQTLSNAERYTTERLKEIEELILGAEDKLNSLEYDIFVRVREEVANQMKRIQKTAKAVAALDSMQSLANVAYKYNFTKPLINDKGVIDIKNGRHPVIEKIVGEGSFIANDTYLDNQKHRMSIITGPNMAGKSTYMRQTALIVLMAQIGSFVPAESADIAICDRIFTRVGASDDLASGQSTFMVEMTEVSNILRNATKQSLIILDEIGRGTSTFDGLSIAWAVVEHISNNKVLGAKTLFATHYHELTELEGVLAGVNNYCVSVKENGDDIIFLRKIVKGGADKSYGIQVAKLAGVPEPVIERAKELVEELSNLDLAKHTKNILASDKKHKPIPRQNDVEATQLSFFATTKDDDIISEIKAIDLGLLTPIDALNVLYKLQNKIKNRI